MGKVLAAGLGLALLAAGATALAQREVREKDTAKATTGKVRKVTAIIGSEVRLREGGLGKVTDIVVNENGCIDYLIVGEREDYVAVPWGVVRYDPGERSIMVTTTVTRDKLRGMRFRGTEWPDFYSERWTRSAGEVWGEKYLRRPHRDGVRRDDIRRDDIRKDDIRDKRKDDKRPPVRPPDKQGRE